MSQMNKEIWEKVVNFTTKYPFCLIHLVSVDMCLYHEIHNMYSFFYSMDVFKWVIQLHVFSSLYVRLHISWDYFSHFFLCAQFSIRKALEVNKYFFYVKHMSKRMMLMMMMKNPTQNLFIYINILTHPVSPSSVQVIFHNIFFFYLSLRATIIG